MSYPLIVDRRPDIRILNQVSKDFDLPHNKLANVSFREIDAVAYKHRLPVHDTSIFVKLHKAALPIIENRLRHILRKHEAEKPRYYFLARDASTLMTALSVSSEGFELSKRIYSITYSKVNRDIADQAIPESGDRNKHIQYLGQFGIDSEILSKGNPVVMVDTALVGTLFDHFINLFSQKTTQIKIPSSFYGYLLCRDDSRSRYEEIIQEDLECGALFYDLFEKFVLKEWISNQNSVLGNLQKFGLDVIKDYPIQRKINWALATYLQMMPKSFPRSCGYEFFDDAWVPIYESKRFPSLDYSLIMPDENSVDPIAACKLRVLTIRYFSQQKVIDGLLS